MYESRTQKEFLIWSHCPERMNAAKPLGGSVLNQTTFPFWSLPASSSAGQSTARSREVFLTTEIEQKKGDARWMNKATETHPVKVKDKNERAAKSRDRKARQCDGHSARNGNCERL